jgi:hypothetical protein
MVRMIIAIASADGNFRLSGKNRSRPKSRRNYASLLRNSSWNNGFTNPAASGSFAVLRQAGPRCGCQHRRKAAGHRLQTRNSLQPCQLAHPTTLAYKRHVLGIWESTESEEFGLMYGSTSIPVAKIVKLGSGVRAAFTPYTAQWGEARFGKKQFLCITFNFAGLGQSGSFQNIRGLYLIDVSKPPKFYYTVGGIRAIRDQ